MNKPVKSFLTPKWLEIKKLYKTQTNGNDQYGENCDIGGELDVKASAFVQLLGELTRRQGPYAVIEDVIMELWKERIWAVIENAGLLPPIAWKMDKEEEEAIEAREMLEKQWYQDLDEWKLENEENAKTFVNNFDMTSSLDEGEEIEEEIFEEEEF